MRCILLVLDDLVYRRHIQVGADVVGQSYVEFQIEARQEFLAEIKSLIKAL